jgi:hypothetical protein
VVLNSSKVADREVLMAFAYVEAEVVTSDKGRIVMVCHLVVYIPPALLAAETQHQVAHMVVRSLGV